MKKILLVFLLVFATSFSWEVIEQENEFKEKTGEVVIVKESKDKSMGFSVLKGKKGYSFAIVSGKYIGGKGTSNTSLIKIKLGDGEILKLNGIVPKGNAYVVIVVDSNENKNVVEKMKKNKNMKIVVEKYDGSSLFGEFDITNLNNALMKIK